MSTTTAERVLRLALQFLDLSRDVGRNRDDTQLTADGGEIVYVFDANVFEVFMRPFDSRGQYTSLHASHWPSGALAMPDAGRRSLAAQTALLTTEFLLSGNLPGQAHGFVYLTEWHSWEFAHRVRYLAKQQGTLGGDELKRQLERLNALVSADRAESAAELEALAAADPVLSADLQHIATNAPLSPENRRSFILNRKLLDLLAEDEALEPVEQLSRLLSPSIRRRMRILHNDFPPGPNAASDIRQDAQFWLGLLEDECRARGIRVVEGEVDEAEKERTRRRSALRADAKTLADVRWLAANAFRRGRRIVLVTADTLMFDVYRRWYASLQPSAPEYSEPFILRRLLQYAPIFNLADARHAIGDDVRSFFGRLQSVIEVTLLPINLGRGRNEAHEMIINRMRELTALKLLSNRAVSEELSYQPWRQAIESNPGHERSLVGLLDEWRRLERTTLGASDDFVRERLLSKRQSYPELFADEVAEGAITTYIGRLITELYQGSVALWLPLARDVVLQWTPPPRKLRSRAPISFRLHLGDDRKIDLGHAVDLRLSGAATTPLSSEIDWNSLQQQPQALFALAACLALASEDWGNADHFAEMALREPPTNDVCPDAGTAGSDERLLEIKYLNALTKRFRLGAIGPARNSDALARVDRTAHDARELLDDCIEHHGRLAAGRPQALRLLRAWSERAALSLFKAAAIIPAVRAAPVRTASGELGGRSDAGFSLQDAADLRREAAAMLSHAEHDLNACYLLDVTLPDVDESRQSLLDRVREQYFVNTVATCVLRRLLAGGEADPFAGLNRGLIERLDAEVADGAIARAAERTPLLAAFRFAYLMLRGDEQAAASLERLRYEKVRSSLSIDASVFSAVTRQMRLERAPAPA
jgi:hypothetical protein